MIAQASHRRDLRLDPRCAFAFAAMILLASLAASDLQPWRVMVIVITALFLLFKMLSWQLADVPRMWRLAYNFGWVGMDMKSFIRPARSLAPPRQWLSAATCITLGAILLWGVSPRIEIMPPIFRGWAGMIGCVLLLHFGLFHALALMWRSIGAGAQPIMHAPLLAPTVGALWSRHWNLAFHDITRRMLFRPVFRAWGPAAAIMVSFLASGLIHELAVSVPARAGFGGPTLYFLLQACAVLFERTHFAPTGLFARLFTVAIVVGPIGILFHPPFVERVALPLLAQLGAL